MPEWHGLLKRQVQRIVGDLEKIGGPWRQLLDAVNAAYREFDADRRMLERSLDLTSQELLERNRRLRAELARLTQTEESLRFANEQLQAKMVELEILNRAMFGREERVLELEEEIRALQARLASQTTPPRA